MKIAYIVLKGIGTGGGIEKYTIEVGSRLAERGHEVIVYTTRRNGNREGVYRGMQIKTVPAIKSRALEKMSAALSASFLQLFEKRIDVVHYHAFGPGMFSFIPQIIGRKIIVQGHGLEWKRSKWGRLGRSFLRLSEIPSVMFPDRVSVVSEVQREYLRERYGKESVHIPTGVSSPEYAAPGAIKKFGLNGKDYVLFAARLVREKGAHYLIRAYKKLNHGKIKLVIAGDAEHEREYKSELKELSGGDPDIIFTGFATGGLLRELYSNALIFVLPSDIEGLPTALLEAMSYGNLCLASDIPENQECLNGLGFTFRRADEEDLAEKLECLLSENGNLNEIRRKAKAHALDNYSWSAITDRYERLYKELLD
jgi:glycosyltransferase involved in cell wall biosynthesis